MKKIINKIGKALQLILQAPVKLPGKSLEILKYLAIGVDILESVIDENDASKTEGSKEEGGEDESQ